MGRGRRANAASEASEAGSRGDNDRNDDDSVDGSDADAANGAPRPKKAKKERRASPDSTASSNVALADVAQAASASASASAAAGAGASDSEKSSKPLKKRGKARQQQPEAAEEENDAEDEGDDDDEDDEYEVEKILDVKKERGKTMFLIRWKGYQPESDTWEPENTLSCPELIAKFKKSQSLNGNKKGKKDKSPKKNKTGKEKNSDEKEKGTKKKEEYEVEKILDVQRTNSGKREFLIRWKGWNSKHDTWEPEDNLNCRELVNDFLEREGSKKKSPRERKTPLPYVAGNKRTSKRGRKRVAYKEDDVSD